MQQTGAGQPGNGVCCAGRFQGAFTLGARAGVHRIYYGIFPQAGPCPSLTPLSVGTCRSPERRRSPRPLIERADTNTSELWLRLLPRFC